jgi:ribose transport system substrate-binding protein
MTRRELLKAGLFSGGALSLSGLLTFMQYRQADAQENGPLKAAMSSAGLAGTWNAQGQEAALAWAKLFGVEVTWFDGQFDAEKQRSAVDQMATQQWDFVAIQPNTIGTLVDPVTTMIEAGIPFIDMDTLIAPFDQMKQIGVLNFCAPDNSFMSQSVVTKLVQKMGGKGKIAHIGGQPGHTGAQARQQGMLNVLKDYPDVELVDDQPGNWDLATAAALAESFLNRFPDLNAIFADNDDMALSARQVVENAGMQDQVLIGGVDAMPPAIQAVADGKLVGTARNSACRIHGWAVVIGAYAATVGLEQARNDVPFYILADGPAIFGDIDNNPDLADTPWKLNNYGMSSAEGQLWLESQYLF